MANGTYEETAAGNQQYSSREAFENPYDSTQRAQLADRIAASWFTGAVGKDLELFDGKDLRVEPRVRLRIADGRAVTGSGSSGLIRIPLNTMSGLLTMARELEQATPRRFPIAAQSVFGYGETTIEMEMTLPEGWTADLPTSVDVSGPFGDYQKLYSQEGRVLRVKRLVRGKTGTLPPEQIGELIAFLRAVAVDDATMIVVKR
jgi:hypothetical protein